MPVRGRYDKHIFVCVNERADGHPRGCCLAKGSAEVHARLKRLLKEKGLKGRMRANRALCLDTCELGPSVVVYPDNVWYGGVQPEDVEELVESHLLEGRPVERLRIPEERLRQDLRRK